jgi:hypothetical protein
MCSSAFSFFKPSGFFSFFFAKIGDLYSRNPVYARCLDPSVLAFSLSLHRHPFICILFSSRFTCYNKFNLEQGEEFNKDTRQIRNGLVIHKKEKM